jgi:UPF0271 protein
VGAGRAIDLNADLAEGFPWDDALLDLVTSASLCCGAHAGDRDTLRRAAAAAQARGVQIGLHPGFDDRPGFGRRERGVKPQELMRAIAAQAEFFAEATTGLEIAPGFLKPHGALYNQAQRDPDVAQAVVLAAQALALPVLGQPAGEVDRAAAQLGLRFIAEGFADRAYQPDGRLVPRDQPGALLSDPDAIRAQILQLVNRRVETLCLHGDQPGAVELGRQLREILDAEDIAVLPFSTTLPRAPA